MKTKTFNKKDRTSKISSWSQWFDKSARYYDDHRMKMAYYENGKPMAMDVVEAIHKDVWNKLNANKECAFLDIGSGSGLFFKAFRHRLRYMVGADISFAMIQGAYKLNPDGAFLICEASALPLQPKSFDRILCYSVFHYLKTSAQAKKVLDEFTRVINNKGLILIGDILKPETHLRKANLKNNNGFKTAAWWPPALTHDLKKQTFDPSFFIDYCKKRNYNCLILKQDIPGKSTAGSRYDVIIKAAHE